MKNKLRIFNVLLLTVLMVFSVFYGFTNYQKNLDNMAADNLFESHISSLINDIIKAISDEINITNSNKNRNNITAPSNTPNTDKPEVNFTSFHQMYSYAVEQFNKANYIHTTASGVAYMQGSAPSLNITVPETALNLSLTRAKELNERYFRFSLTGKLLDSIPTLNLLTEHYTNGTIYEYTYPQAPLQKLTADAYLNLLQWNMTELFHLPNAAAAAKITDKEIVAFYFDEPKKEYVAKLNIDATNFQTNFGSIIKSITGSSNNPLFTKIELTIKVDKQGNFKSIQYVEDFSAKIVFAGNELIGKVRTSYTETFTIINNGYVDVTRPPHFNNM